MKILKFLVILLLFPVLTLTGCGSKNVDYVSMQKDESLAQSQLTFYYDELTHTAYFGGEGEQILYYDIDIARGFEKEGNRVGVKMYAPSEVTDFASGFAEVGGEKIEGGRFYSTVNGHKSREATFYPLVSQDNRVIELKIKWEEGIKEQHYTIVIAEGTIFLEG